MGLDQEIQKLYMRSPVFLEAVIHLEVTVLFSGPGRGEGGRGIKNRKREN